MSTISKEQEQAIQVYLDSHYLPVGLGTKEEACSVAAINLVLTGELTDNIPLCMSEVIGKWIISTQDAIPDSLRNSAEWKSLLPFAAGTGREKEKERVEFIMEWMWTQVLPQLQDYAEKEGFGVEWKKMCEEKTEQASYAAAYAANAYANAYAANANASNAAANAATAATNAAYAANAANAAYAAIALAAAYAAIALANAAYANANAATNAATALANAANAATALANAAAAATALANAANAANAATALAAAAAANAATAAFWNKVNPCGLLKKLIEL